MRGTNDSTSKRLTTAKEKFCIMCIDHRERAHRMRLCKFGERKWEKKRNKLHLIVVFVWARRQSRFVLDAAGRWLTPCELIVKSFLQSIWIFFWRFCCFCFTSFQRSRSNMISSSSSSVRCINCNWPTSTYSDNKYVRFGWLAGTAISSCHLRAEQGINEVILRRVSLEEENNLIIIIIVSCLR